MAKLRFSDGCCGRILGLVVMFLLFGSYPFSVVYGASGSSGYRIFTLKHISGDRGKGYLGEAGIGTVSQLSGSPALLVTGGAEEVAKAKAILDLVDAPEEYVIRAILPASEFEGLPSVAEIAGKLGGISVGTFADPPAGTDGARAIIGIGNDSVVVVAPSSRLERIVAAIGQLVEGKKSAKEAERVESKRAKETPGAAKIEVVRPGDANEPNGVTVVPKQEGPKKDEAEKRPLYEPKPSINADQVLKVTLPPKLEIVHLMGLVGEYLNLNFMYDPLKIKGEVTLMLTGDLRGPIKVGDLYPLLESVLQFRGFGMTRNRNLVTIVPLPEVMEKDPIIVETEADTITEHGHVILTRIFKLEHIDVASAQNLLTGMKLGTNVSPVGEAKMLFVTGYAYRMPRVERLLKMIDKPGKPKKIRFRQLQYTMATALAPKIKTLAEQLGTVSITVGQMSSSSAPSSFSGRLPGETTAQYSARLAKERAARTSVASRGRAAPSAPSPEPGVYLDADERTNRILMIGFDEQLDSVEELIDTLDVAQTIIRTLKLYKIEHVDAEAARGKLQELGIVSGGRGSSSSSTGSRITGGSRVGATTKAPTAPSPPTSSRTAPSSGGALEPLVEEPLVVIIEATNSLLVSATAEQHDEIETILEFVDAATEEGVHPYVIYPLENQKPEDLAAILEKLIQETIKDKEGKIEQVVKKTDEEIVIVPDENTFSIIVYASKKNQEWISSLIKTLDKRRPQVLIDVTLVEVTKNDKFEYDLNLISSLPNLVDTSGLTGVITEGKTSADIISQLSSSDHLARYIDFQSNAGRATGFYGDSHIHALLNAMQTKDYGRVLAKPKILVNDNEQGTIGTTDTTYVTKTSSIPVSSGGAGTDTTLIQTAVDYEGYDAGITLDITPHISEGALLRLEILLTRKDFGTITGDKPPDTTSTDITTVVTVPDGSTIILGGMIKLNQGKGGTKVPIFGDLPLIGPLFRSVSNTDLQRRLYIFVKAEIIRPAETLAQGLPDLERISDRNRLAFEKFEQEFQSYKNFPGIKARPVAPIKVLEDE